MKNNITVRAARPADLPAILEILELADLRYRRETLDGFHLAERDGRVAGIVRLDERPDFVFLTSLGVRPELRGQGIGTALLRQLLRPLRKPVYLYTIIPGFFARLGFARTDAPAALPPKELFGCDQCLPGRCLCMLKSPDDTPLP